MMRGVMCRSSGLCEGFHFVGFKGRLGRRRGISDTRPLGSLIFPFSFLLFCPLYIPYPVFLYVILYLCSSSSGWESGCNGASGISGGGSAVAFSFEMYSIFWLLFFIQLLRYIFSRILGFFCIPREIRPGI